MKRILMLAAIWLGLIVFTYSTTIIDRREAIRAAVAYAKTPNSATETEWRKQQAVNRRVAAMSAITNGSLVFAAGLGVWWSAMFLYNRFRTRRLTA